jgi:hypothetical protein
MGFDLISTKFGWNIKLEKIIFLEYSKTKSNVLIGKS